MTDNISSGQVGAILARLEQARETARDDNQAPPDQFLRFQLGEVNYALPVSAVRGVDKPPTLTYVPGAPSYVLGVGNRRGAVLPVISLAELLGSTIAEISRATRIVLIQDADPGGLIALLVDRLLDVINVTDENIEPPMTTMQQGALLRGQTRLRNSQMVLLLNPDELLKRITRRGDGG